MTDSDGLEMLVLNGCEEEEELVGVDDGAGLLEEVLVVTGTVEELSIDFMLLAEAEELVIPVTVVGVGLALVDALLVLMIFELVVGLLEGLLLDATTSIVT